MSEQNAVDRATGAIVSERQRCICDDMCLDHCRACNWSARDLEEPCIADPCWEPDDDDLERRMTLLRGLSTPPGKRADA